MSTTTMNNISAYIDCTDLLGRPNALRAGAAKRGSLCFRALLPTEDVQLVQREVLQTAARHELLQPGSKAEEGIVRAKIISLEVIGVNFLVGFRSREL